MTATLRYVRFHIDQCDCQCCGRLIKKGTIELSDGRRYGPQCSARARGIPRQPAAEVKRIEQEAARLAAVAAHAGWRTHYQPSEWTWTAKGYGGNVGWALTDIYRTASGEYRAVVGGDPNTTMVIYGSSIKVLGRDKVAGAILLVANRDALDKLARSSGATIEWTSDRYAAWRFRAGWTE